MPYWRLFYHFVWATKERYPFLEPRVEAVLYPVLRRKAEDRGVMVLAANGMPDHVHLVASVPPRIAIADLIASLKGITSYAVSREFDMPFAWQHGYGAFSLSERGLKIVIRYVEQQKQHHADNTTVPQLERMGESG